MREKKLILTLSVAMMLTACGAKETTQESGTAQSVEEVQVAAMDETTEDQTANGNDGEALVKKAVEAAQASAEQARDFLADDFDGDGSTEAFVYIGDEQDIETATCSGDIWFVSDEKCEKIEEDMPFLVQGDKVIKDISEDNKKFILIDMAGMFMSGSATDIFYVENGECKRSAISGIGGFYKSELGDYCVNVDTYDMNLEFESAADADDPNVFLEYIPVLEKGMYTGHTWKEYFFYYDKASGDFKEYASKELTEQELATACGFDLAGEIKAEGYQMGKIYRRDNGVINVNYYMRTDNADGSVSIDFKNATYNEKTKAFMYESGEGESSWQKSDCSGIFAQSIT